MAGCGGCLRHCRGIDASTDEPAGAQPSAAGHGHRIGVERSHHYVVTTVDGYEGFGDCVVGVPIRVTRVVLHLDVDPHSGAGVDGLGEVGHPWSEIAQFSSAHCDDRTVAPSHRVVVVNDEYVIGRSSCIEFNGIGSEFCRQPEGLDRVFAGGKRSATMGNDPRSSLWVRHVEERTGRLIPSSGL